VECGERRTLRLGFLLADLKKRASVETRQTIVVSITQVLCVRYDFLLRGLQSGGRARGDISTDELPIWLCPCGPRDRLLQICDPNFVLVNGKCSECDIGSLVQLTTFGVVVASVLCTGLVAYCIIRILKVGEPPHSIPLNN
jgi:hypothetical protein